MSDRVNHLNDESAVTPIKLGLERIMPLLIAAGSPHQQFPVVLVAGTNGKGSVAATIDAALVHAGFVTGRFTSPPLVEFREQFAVSGKICDATEIERAAKQLRALLDAPLRDSGEPTPFEFATAMAFWLFANRKVEIGVLELGLGSALDAVNAAANVVLVVMTSISVDHTDYFGSDLISIARHEATVIRPLVPVVVGRVSPEVLETIRASALERHSPVVYTPDVVAVYWESGPTCRMVSARSDYGVLSPALAGRHQRDNSSTAVATLEVLNSERFRVTREDIIFAIQSVVWPARLERFQWAGADVLLDAAHNPAGARALAAYLADIGWTNVTLVFGAMRDKNVRGMLEPLLPFCAHAIATTAPNPRAMDAAEIADIMRHLAPPSVTTAAIPDYAAAIERAAGLGRPVVAAGSIFLIGPLRDILR